MGRLSLRTGHGVRGGGKKVRVGTRKRRVKCLGALFNYDESAGTMGLDGWKQESKNNPTGWKGYFFSGLREVRRMARVHRRCARLPGLRGPKKGKGGSRRREAFVWKRTYRRTRGCRRKLQQKGNWGRETQTRLGTEKDVQGQRRRKGNGKW